MTSSIAFLQCAQADHVLDLRIARTFFSRLRGLMLAAPLAPAQGMLLLDCSNVHTGFMRQTIDVVYLDRSGVVTCCESQLKPWRASRARVGTAGGAQLVPCHTLELAQGTIAMLGIAPGDRLVHPALIGEDRRGVRSGLPEKNRRLHPRVVRQKGSAMIEFAVVGPIITLLGLATLQYGMLFFAKNQYNHASFMAARAGTTGNANFTKIQDAYTRALIPLFAQGISSADLQTAFNAAKTEVATNTNIEVLNPTAESFADFNDEALQKVLGITGSARVIPNGGLAFRHASVVRSNSGQNIQDANLLKLRITHGFKLKVPLMGLIYSKYLTWLDTGANTFNTAMIKDQRVPVVTHVTLQMQSDAIEDKIVSTPGAGNGGTPTNPGEPPAVTIKPPECGSIGCTSTPNQPGGSIPGDGTQPGDGTGPGGPCIAPA